MNTPNPNPLHFAAPFTASNVEVGTLLSQSMFLIPELQRPYAWKPQQATELVRDIKRLLDAKSMGITNPQHFFGTLVVLDKYPRGEIVDGQQRLTTVSVLLGVIQQTLSDLEKAITAAGGPQAAINAQNCATLRTNVKDKLRKMGPIQPGAITPEILVLEVSPEVRDMFVSLTGVDNLPAPFVDKTPSGDLRNVAGVFRDELIVKYFNKCQDNLEKLQHLELLYDVVQKGLVLVKLGTQASSSAYELFESLNARGVDLNALDLLKVWMLAVLANANINQAQVAKQMRSLASGDVKKQINFFEDFYYARTNLKPKDGTKEYKELAIDARKNLFGDTSFADAKVLAGTVEQRIQDEVTRMEELSDIWFDLKGFNDPLNRVPRIFAGCPDHDWLKHRLDLLLGSTLGHKGAVYPLLMIAADKLRNNPADFIQLVHLIERFFFRFRTVCKGSEVQIADVYMKIIRQLEANGGLNFSVVTADLNAKTKASAHDQEFQDMLVREINYKSSANRLKYFFNMIEIYSYNPKPKRRVADLKDWSIEHIYPQTPQNGAVLPDDELHSMGNLCLLDPKVNSHLRNLDFSAKKAKVAQLGALPAPRTIKIDDADARSIFEGALLQWGPSEITTRENKLIKDALAIFGETLNLI